jgi:hypothetical protein
MISFGETPPKYRIDANTGGSTPSWKTLHLIKPQSKPDLAVSLRYLM